MYATTMLASTCSTDSFIVIARMMKYLLSEEKYLLPLWPRDEHDISICVDRVVRLWLRGASRT
jgi:hypothetical protein